MKRTSTIILALAIINLLGGVSFNPRWLTPVGAIEWQTVTIGLFLLALWFRPS